MNVTDHQEKNEETKKGKTKAGEERRQATDFKEAVCSPSEAGGRTTKNGLCEVSARGDWNSWEGQQPF